MIKIFIVDDHQMMIDGIKAYFENDTEIEIIGSSISYDNAIRKIRNSNLFFDILLTDLNLKDKTGLDLIRKLKEANQNCEYMVLTMYFEKNIISELKKLGVKGFLHKDAPQLKLREAVINVSRGQSVFPENSPSENLNYDFKSDNATAKDNFGVKYKLSKRELQVALLVTEGKSTDEIAKELELSPATVSTHRKNLQHKTKTSTPLELYKILGEMK